MVSSLDRKFTRFGVQEMGRLQDWTFRRCIFHVKKNSGNGSFTKCGIQKSIRDK